MRFSVIVTIFEDQITGYLISLNAVWWNQVHLKHRDTDQNPCTYTGVSAKNSPFCYFLELIDRYYYRKGKIMELVISVSASGLVWHWMEKWPGFIIVDVFGSNVKVLEIVWLFFFFLEHVLHKLPAECSIYVEIRSSYWPVDNLYMWETFLLNVMYGKEQRHSEISLSIFVIRQKIRPE